VGLSNFYCRYRWAFITFYCRYKWAFITFYCRYKWAFITFYFRYRWTFLTFYFRYRWVFLTFYCRYRWAFITFYCRCRWAFLTFYCRYRWTFLTFYVNHKNKSSRTFLIRIFIVFFLSLFHVFFSSCSWILLFSLFPFILHIFPFILHITNSNHGQSHILLTLGIVSHLSSVFLVEKRSFSVHFTYWKSKNTTVWEISNALQRKKANCHHIVKTL